MLVTVLLFFTQYAPIVRITMLADNLGIDLEFRDVSVEEFL